MFINKTNKIAKTKTLKVKELKNEELLSEPSKVSVIPNITFVLVAGLFAYNTDAEVL